jgi:hypothetical protein
VNDVTYFQSCVTLCGIKGPTFVTDNFIQLKNVTMKTNESLQKEAQVAIRPEPILNKREFRVFTKVSKPFKMLVYAAGLAGIGLLFNGCMAGYVASEPSYVEVSRPPRPSNLSVWIEGDWNWNNQTHVYVQRTGYWENPRQGRSYVSGHWQTTPRGKSWSKGHWQSDGRHQRNSRDRKYR